jgi:hypothetical protein
MGGGLLLDAAFHTVLLKQVQEAMVAACPALPLCPLSG